MLPDGFPAGKWLLKKARELGVEKSPPPDLLRGRDLIAFGFKPGMDFGKIIKLGNRLRDEKNFNKAEVFQTLDGITETKEAVEKLETILNKPES